MSFDRISDIPELEAEEHYSLLTNDKLWLFSKKFVDQPTYSSGQRVTHKGGYSVYFDLNTKKWSNIKEFNALSTEEHVDELLFVQEDKICCLLYSNMGKIQFLQLAVFDTSERQFTMWNEFNMAAVNASVENETYKQRLIVADGALTDKSRLLIASVEGNLHLFKLSIDFSSKHASISDAAKYSAEQRNSMLLLPINAAVHKDQVILEYANRAGCVVRWETSQIDRLSIEKNGNESFERIEIKGTQPNFSFLGAKMTAFLNEGEWLHFGGNIQKGMTGREFNGEVWNLKNGFSQSPEWKKLDGIEIPKEAEDAEFAFDIKKKVLYIVDKKNGLFSGQL